MNLKIDFKAVVEQLIPSKILNQVQVSWVSSLIYPLQQINDSFANYGKDIKYYLSFNGQVIYLEHILNDLFDPIQRRIYITDSDPLTIDNYFIFYELEAQPGEYVSYESEATNTPYILYESELSTYSDFTVWIPTQLLTSFNTPKIRAIVDKYKIASKRYNLRGF